MPDSRDLDAMLEEARRQRGEAIELKWHSQDNDKYLVLAIKWESTENQPSWECSEILSTMRKLIWNYTTRDLTFVGNLITACSAKPLPPEELRAALDRRPRP
ncbi:MAG: hypothetical protein IT342_19010 [Candidatus Melainabacteria bacterium]|nr:hypothetical protein [Candidatus Melainabacteria bacterium]